jgi:hypothetical protein
MAVTTDDHPVVVVMAIKEFERVKALNTRPALTPARNQESKESMNATAHRAAI